MPNTTQRPTTLTPSQAEDSTAPDKDGKGVVSAATCSVSDFPELHSVPPEIAVCPECGGELYWQTDTVIEDGILIDCADEDWENDDGEHRGWQSLWQPVNDRVKAWVSKLNVQAMTAPHQTPIPDNALPALVISDLLAVGFKFEPSTGRFWHWTESPGIELIDGKWFPCDMFDNGNMQYSDDGYESPVEAAKQAVQFFS